MINFQIWDNGSFVKANGNARTAINIARLYWQGLD